MKKTLKQIMAETPVQELAGLSDKVTIVADGESMTVDLGVPTPYNPNRKYVVPVDIVHHDGKVTKRIGGFIDD